MDIGALSSALSQASLASKVGVAITKKALDTATQDSQALTQMMQSSANPNLGSKIDVKL